ncbi:MAG: hypothetical protein BroJett013_06870 [Alphaproteobacteria bacterium]|nr:MAG: hypothetical protein BroJett013_06870 [Alphaproteobacteria bacterium]
MNQIAKERQRIDALLASGEMTAKDHRRITRALNTEAKRRAKAEAETRLMLARAATRKAYRSTVLRSQLQRSLEGEA